MKRINWSTNPWDITDSEYAAPLNSGPERPLSARAKEILSKPESQRTDAEKGQLLRELQREDSSISGSRLQNSRINSAAPKSQGNSFSPQEINQLAVMVSKSQDITTEMLKGIRDGNFHLTEIALQQVAETDRTNLELIQAVLTRNQPQSAPIQRANFRERYPRHRDWLRNEWGGGTPVET